MVLALPAFQKNAAVVIKQLEDAIRCRLTITRGFAVLETDAGTRARNGHIQRKDLVVMSTVRTQIDKIRSQTPRAFCADSSRTLFISKSSRAVALFVSAVKR